MSRNPELCQQKFTFVLLQQDLDGRVGEPSPGAARRSPPIIPIQEVRFYCNFFLVKQNILAKILDQTRVADPDPDSFGTGMFSSDPDPDPDQVLSFRIRIRPI